MKVECQKVPIAFKIQLVVEALAPEFKQLRDLIDENKTFVPDLLPLLEELNNMLDGWRAPIEGPCGSSEYVTGDALRDKLRKDIEKNSQLGRLR